MSEPVAGKQYTIVPGDTLSEIAMRAYGRAQWRKIWEANQTILKSGDPDLIYPGEVIFIPILSEEKKLKRDLSTGVIDKDKNVMTLVVDGYEIPVRSGKVLRTMDTCADGWTAVIPWSPGVDSRLDDILKPFAYKEAKVYLGGKLMVSGHLYATEPGIGGDGIEVELEGWSYTADVIDSTMKPPYEENNIKLEQRAKKLVEPLGIAVEFDDEAKKKNRKFDRVTAEPTETIFSHLAKLAAQAGVLISSTPYGDMLFTRAKTTGKPVGTIEEGGTQAQNFKIKFDGRKRFNTYRVISDSPSSPSKVSIAKDTKVPKSRFITYKADENTEGGIKDSAEWRRSKQVAEALTIDFPVTSWYDPNGEIWTENTLVTLKSKTLFIPDGFTFLIRQVQFDYSDGGSIATLSLVPPTAYSGESLKEPW